MKNEPLLLGFAYGEDRDEWRSRSLGFRLRVPATRPPWCDEVEQLARRLQAAEYPLDWPIRDYLCSVLSSEGRRLIALARYGLTDNTPDQRRGGFEFVGVMAPGNLGVSSTWAVREWLIRRRETVLELTEVAPNILLADALAYLPPESSKSAPPWLGDVVVWSASAPEDVDRGLSFLHPQAPANWQILPLVNADFPLAEFAQRGPVVAWTPHLRGIAWSLAGETGDLQLRKFVTNE